MIPTYLSIAIVLTAGLFAPNHPQYSNTYRPAPRPPLVCDTWQVNCNAHGGCEQHCERCGNVVVCRPGAR